MSRTLVYSRKALADLDEIFDFIVADNARRAATYIREIETACEGLCTTPMMGMRRPDIRPDLRVLPLWKKIVVAYRLPARKVRIVRIFSRGQDYQSIMAGN